MRFIEDLSQDTIQLLQKIYQKSKHHRVRQRAQCMLLSYQGYTIKELAHIFHVDRITIYHWFSNWESRRFAGLYDRKGKGRHPIFDQEQKEQIRQWVKLYPKNMNKVIAFIQKEFDLSASKSTIKRILKSLQMSWRRIRRKVNGQPNPEIYKEQKESLEVLIEEDKQGKCLSKINFIFVSKILDHPFDILNKVRKVGICPEFDPFILHKTP